MIIIPEIKLLLLITFLFFIFLERKIPRDIKISETKSVDIVVKEMFNPEMLAPIPRPKLFKESAMESERDSFKSIFPDLSLSAISGFSSMQIGEFGLHEFSMESDFFSLK